MQFGPMDEKTVRAYRECFTSPAGRIVLNHLLRSLGVFHPAQNEGEAVMRNIGIEILENCGVLHESNSQQITDNLLAVEAPAEWRNDGY